MGWRVNIPKALRGDRLCAYDSRGTILSHIFHIHQVIGSQGENPMAWDTLLFSITTSVPNYRVLLEK